MHMQAVITVYVLFISLSHKVDDILEAFKQNAYNKKGFIFNLKRNNFS